MTRPFIACLKFDLDFVFKVTMIKESFHISNFEGGTYGNLWVWMIFILIYDTSIELPNINQPDQFDLCQGHSSNRYS